MKFYKIEADSKTMKSTITLGSKQGYEGAKEFTLEETIDLIGKANSSMNKLGLPNVPCIVREGILVGRAENKDYQEKVYSLEFSWSPRIKKINSKTFYNSMLYYADFMGNEMKQKRVYLEFNNETRVLKLK